MISSAKTRRITNELFKFEHEKVSQKLKCYLVNHDESDMQFVRFLPQEILINIVLKYPSDYPWKPPQIKVNGHNYIRLLQITQPWKHKYINTRCLCCSSIMCISNWSPFKTVSDILTEVCNNLDLKLKFNEIRHVKKIKNKYLNNDIPIEDYL
tara:strand:- start:275 stop:733 length:459 start_codon:yes stop_codon:yes gene_type:complete